MIKLLPQLRKKKKTLVNTNNIQNFKKKNS